ncbi:hypothetical protein [Klebsiella pneumoniae]|uniref:hypothetical protein n=1 Tax=Klebsiella pneumoniae TaxID=573 RepID=UPI00403ABDCA
MKSALISPLLAGLLLLTGCAQPAAQAGGGGGGTIKAINHTKWAINHFSVNGRGSIQWPFRAEAAALSARPLTPRCVEWAAGSSAGSGLMRNTLRKKVDARTHKPFAADYNGCVRHGALTCDDVKVTSCWSPRNATSIRVR